MIEFKHVSKTYPNGVKGLKDVNLKFEQGEFVAIIGLSGAGKSTLIRTINRMIDITEGELTVDGTDVSKLSGKALRKFRRKIGMIFQSFNLVTRATALKNVLTSMVPDMGFFRVLFGMFTKEQKLAALAALDKVGILDKAYIRCDQLSGGQQQRVALARTLNQNPSIILADEPVAALDPVTAHQVMADFKRINEEMNITILITSIWRWATRSAWSASARAKSSTTARLARSHRRFWTAFTTAPPCRRPAATEEGAFMKKTAASGAKTPLFDRIFKPEVITLENGHTVTRPRSRTPLIALLVIAALAISIKVTGFNLAIIVKRANQLTKILSQIFQPDPSFFSKVVTPLLDTIKMSIMGSVIGCLLALPYAVAASANINRNKVSLSVLRFILNIVRTLPTLVIASICALVFGLGTFAGTVAIVIFTFGVVTKMLYESIETINMGPFEALESAGADKFRAFWSAVFPQVLPTYLSHCLYSFEMNVRAASILGYVGAGGLGILIDERIGWRDYNGLGTVLLTLFVAVLIIENLSQFLRSKLS